MRSLEALDAALATHVSGRSFLVTTFHRSLFLRKPRLTERIRRDWRPARSFAVTIGDGAITIWEEAEEPVSSPASGA